MSRSPNLEVLPQCGLQKSFRAIDIERLTKHPLFSLLKKDVSTGTVFPAIRKNEMHFYHSGGRVCAYKSGAFYTNSRYLHNETDKSRDTKIIIEKEPDAAYQIYSHIKKSCRAHWVKKVADESRQVVSLFQDFSLARHNLVTDTPILLDIEIRFQKLPEQEKNQNKIDLLFLLPNGTMIFIEVKRTKDPRARAREGKDPKVLEQLRWYRQCLEPNQAILDTYKCVLSTIRSVFGLQCAVMPKKLFSNVPLLFVGERPKYKGKDVWLRDTLDKASQWRPGDTVIPLDGCRSPASCLQEFFGRMGDF